MHGHRVRARREVGQGVSGEGGRPPGAGARAQSAAATGQESAHRGQRRLLPDRRQRHPLLSDWRWAVHGRRRGPRRDGDRHQQTDWYPPQLFLAAVGVLVLSAVDAGMTLHLLGTGMVEEANPLMRSLVEHDVSMFLHVKLLVTGLGLVLLVACADVELFRLVRTRRIAYALFAGYALLVAYEIHLLRLTGTG